MLCLAAGLTPAAHAEPSNEDHAKLAQNPVSEMISLPLQNNIEFNTGPRKRTKNVLNIQPIIPLAVAATGK